MSTPTAQHRRRRPAAALVAVTAGIVAAGTLSPGSATASSGLAASDRPAASTATATAAGSLPPLDPRALRQAIADVPSATVTGALVKVGGAAGRWSGTSGVADIRTGRPVPAHGRFRIGSVTKVFTAVVVLQLAAERRVDLDRPVQRYLPGLLPASYPEITVGQLLNHTSGLPEAQVIPPGADARWFVEHRFDTLTPRQIVDLATGRPMAFTPGTEQRYTGVNYFIAGMLVEQVTGNSYADEVRRRILRPLRLRDTYVPDRDDPAIRGPHAHGYVVVDGRLVDITEQSPDSWAQGGMISTSADLTRFLAAVFRDQLLPPAQLAQMFTLPRVPYTGGGGNCRIGPDAGAACFSMGLTRTALPNGVTVWGKSGGVPGYTTAAFATRDLRRTLVYSLNATGNKDGSEGPYIQKLVAAAFDPGLAPPGSGADASR